MPFLVLAKLKKSFTFLFKRENKIELCFELLKKISLIWIVKVLLYERKDKKLFFPNKKRQAKREKRGLSKYHCITIKNA